MEHAYMLGGLMLRAELFGESLEYPASTASPALPNMLRKEYFKDYFNLIRQYSLYIRGTSVYLTVCTYQIWYKCWSGQFTVYTGHKYGTWFYRFREPRGNDVPKLWTLMHFEFLVCYCKWASNFVSDILQLLPVDGRQPAGEADEEVRVSIFCHRGRNVWPGDTVFRKLSPNVFSEREILFRDCIQSEGVTWGYAV